MYRGVLTCLYDSGVLFQDSWDFNVSTSAEALKQLEQVAPARLLVLAACVRIVRLKVTGQPRRDVRWRGTGGGMSLPRQVLNLRHENAKIKKQLRGVPGALFGVRGLTPLGLMAFMEFSRALGRCGCAIVRKGQPPEAITQLQPGEQGIVGHEKGRPATRKKLIDVLGEEEGLAFWDAMKKRI